MKIAIVSDVHLGPGGFSKGVQRKLTTQAPALLADFVASTNGETFPSFVVQLGDLIEDTDRTTDLQNYRHGVELLRRLQAPVYHIVGNHDEAHLQDEELRQLQGGQPLYGSFDAGPYHFVRLHSQSDSGERQVWIDRRQTAWLQADLQQNARPTLVFVHHSLADQDLRGNFWFEEQPESCLVANRHEVRRLLEASGQVLAVINGHLHWNRLDVHSGIAYITVQSLVENLDNAGTAARAWTQVSLSERTVRVEVLGRDRALFEHTAVPRAPGR